jgi:hypothetical protein
MNFSTIANSSRYEDISGVLPEGVDEILYYENGNGFSSLSLHVIPPAGGEVAFELSVDGDHFAPAYGEILGMPGVKVSGLSTEQDVIFSIRCVRLLRIRTTIAGSSSGSAAGRAQD